MFPAILVSIYASLLNHLQTSIFEIYEYLILKKPIVILFIFISHFMGKKLQYLQPLTQTLIEFMENISCVYHQCSLSIAKLLPSDICNEELFTKFESNSFKINDEIDYEALKVNKHNFKFSNICLLNFFSYYTILYIFILILYRNCITPIFWCNQKCYIYWLLHMTAILGYICVK